MSTTASTTATTTSSNLPLLIPALPDDISLNILARIPRSHHPLLSLVSKSFHSLFSSPLFYATRSLLNFSQPFLYLSIRFAITSSLRWFTLYQNSPNPKNPPNFLVQLLPTPSPLVGSATVSLGHKIYVIGGCLNDIPSSHVWTLDCRFHMWELSPKMSISREFAAAGVVNDKIYVIGGCVVDTFARSKYWAEVFDPNIETWEAIDSVREHLLREKWMHASAVINEKVYAMADRNGVVYDPRNRKWESVGVELDSGWRGRACVVDGILFNYDFLGKIKGFDVEKDSWKELRGVEKELPTFLAGATMANVGGKLVVVWEKKGNGKELEIWCAEIEVEKKGEDQEIWGKIKWCDVIHKVPIGSSIVHCLAVTL
ncbi:Protein AFR, putative [Ricinus communis]|uniref:Protein AFR, putative n=1 Tax=Ricinus communis TaxID=3988 RepID=B9T203_RICCO|nr:Protein AFR, putative [Ricinus communis]|eukprot:XP_002532272.1 F-box/kelch-repeat protein SKIP6 [Ricinus communis]